MDLKNARYELTAVKPEQYPPGRLTEIALVGRSNVGKSSIINTLLGQKNLARVAANPGKTRQINFYNVDQTFYLVDLPGYGYARVSKDEKAGWERMIDTYLHTREQLQLLMMLVDIRHAPSGEDQMMYDWLIGQNRPWLMIATKADKIPRNQVNVRLREIRTALMMDETEELIPFSAITGQGRDQIWDLIRRNI